MSLSELANRCEQAAGTDGELDAMIAVAVDFVAVGSNPPSARALHKDYGGNNSYADIGKHWPRLPAYTASIDTAMALVPEWPNHGGYRLTNDSDLKTKFFAELWEHPDAEPGDGWHRGRGATMPLALCAAALRAHAASVDTRPEGGDAVAAPFTGSAVPSEASADAQKAQQ